MSEQKPSDQQIRNMLMQLHEELERTQTLNENEQAMMRHLMEDIQATLARASHQHSSSIVERLEESVETLEVSHPTLSSMIRKALDTLNIAGI
jgi:polyhydroxyalkanoate synthesis regulator phasin